MMEKSYVLGPIFLIILFLLCLFLVLGIKVIFLQLGLIKEKPKVEEPPTPPEKPAKKRKVKPVRMIEIDPDEINRICFKKR